MTFKIERYLMMLLAIVAFALFFGCARDPLEVKRTENPEFNVSFLFECEGVRVYRFYDDGRYHWFTSKGECLNTQKKIIWCGKSCYIHKYDEVL